jgi:4a-hydroxytetrahydrobiopterin dehydratase
MRFNGAVARPSVLPDAEVTAALGTLPGWEREGDEIVKTFDCGSFPAAVAFVVQVGFLAEQANHHPDIDVRWRRVRLALTTHDAGGLTTLDVELARAVEQLGAGA